MTTGPGDQGAAPARGHLRASHADRERVVDVLKAAFVQGRLTEDEFDARIGQALASRTYADLAAITADIPAAPVTRPLPRMPDRAVAWATCVTIAVAALGGAVLLGPGALLFWAVTMLGVLFVTVSQMLYARHERRACRQLPPRPASGGPPSGGPRPEVGGGRGGRTGREPPQARGDETRAELQAYRARPLRLA